LISHYHDKNEIRIKESKRTLFQRSFQLVVESARRGPGKILKIFATRLANKKRTLKKSEDIITKEVGPHRWIPGIQRGK